MMATNDNAYVCVVATAGVIIDYLASYLKSSCTAGSPCCDHQRSSYCYLIL